MLNECSKQCVVQGALGPRTLARPCCCMTMCCKRVQRSTLPPCCRPPSATTTTHVWQTPPPPSIIQISAVSSFAHHRPLVVVLISTVVAGSTAPIPSSHSVARCSLSCMCGGVQSGEPGSSTPGNPHAGGRQDAVSIPVVWDSSRSVAERILG